MSYWNGTRWIPDAPRRGSEPAHTSRAADRIATLLMVMLVPALLVVMTGSVVAGKPGSITVPDGVYGGTTVASVNPGGSGVWVFGSCSQNGTVVWTQYSRPDANNQAVLGLGPTQLWTGGPANCSAEEGYFAHSGHWRSLAATTFNVN